MTTDPHWEPEEVMSEMWDLANDLVARHEGLSLEDALRLAAVAVRVAFTLPHDEDN